MNIDVRELEEAERLIESIDRNELHPANDRTHKDHRQAAAALKLLKSKASESRAQLDVQRLFDD
jgi:hypothetical protein